MKVGDFVKEGVDHGIVLACGPKAFDIVWTGGSTQRYRHSHRPGLVVIAADHPDIDKFVRKHLLGELAEAQAERRRGARIRRGTVSPSR